MKQIKWLYEDRGTRIFQNKKSLFRLMVYRVNNLEWIWSAFSDKGSIRPTLTESKTLGRKGGMGRKGRPTKSRNKLFCAFW